MIGATLLFAENILFVARKGSGCRLFPHVKIIILIISTDR
jgi:hypothetical protein